MKLCLALVLLLASSVPVYAQDCKAFILGALGAVEGAPAPDWKARMEALPAQGFAVNLREGVRPAPDAPPAVMIDSGGNARGRVWVMSDSFVEDGNGNRWFAHEYQVIADGGAPGTFVWAWLDKGGAPPRPCGESTTPPVEPPGELEADVALLKAEVAVLKIDVAQLKADMEALGAATLTAGQVKAMIESALVGLKACGNTGRADQLLPHSHTVCVPVVK